jgi:hypothetical protein
MRVLATPSLCQLHSRCTGNSKGDSAEGPDSMPGSSGVRR